jgi:hypothetical protein
VPEVELAARSLNEPGLRSTAGHRCQSDSCFPAHGEWPHAFTEPPPREASWRLRDLSARSRRWPESGARAPGRGPTGPSSPVWPADRKSPPVGPLQDSEFLTGCNTPSVPARCHCSMASAVGEHSFAAGVRRRHPTRRRGRAPTRAPGATTTAAMSSPFAPPSTSTPTRPYVLLSLLPAWQKSLAFAYRIVLGTRQRPGLLLLDPLLVSGAPVSLLRTLAWTAMGAPRDERSEGDC